MAFLAAIPVALQIAGAAVTALGALKGGKDAKKAANSEADQLAHRAVARRAEAGFSAREERRQARLDQSRALALVAAGGGSVADPSIVNRMGDLQAEGEIGALARLYEGNEESSGLLDAAVNRRREGRAAQRASQLRAASTIMSTAASLQSKYGG
jgi:hypothetical protein